MNRPNILLIMTDQHRYDALGITNKQLKTPHLDRLGRESMQFTNAYTPCALCTPARASLLTGLYPHDHGLLTNNDMYHAVLPEMFDGCRAFSELLREKGYRCGYAGKWHVGHRKLPSTFGFQGMDIPDYGHISQFPGYDEYLKRNNLAAPEMTDAIENPGYAATLAGDPRATSHYYLAEYTDAKIREFSAGNAPFCMWVNFWGPHAPYACEEPYASMYRPEDIEPWPNYDDDLNRKPPLQKRFVETGFELAGKSAWNHWASLVAKYYGYVSALDAQIGRILGTLDELGIRGNTLVIFTTDHGDLTGAHGGLFDKGSTMYEETMHISFIARWPGHVAPGTTQQSFISLLDIMPTLLDIAEAEAPYELAGKSLLPALEDPDHRLRDEFVAEWHGHRFLNSQRMIRVQHYKYVFSPPGEDELYDLERDPYEMRSVLDDPSYRIVLAELQKRLFDHLVNEKDPLRFAAGFLLHGRKIPKKELMYPHHLRLAKRDG